MLYMEEDIYCGMFDSGILRKNAARSQDRQVTCYEIELFQYDSPKAIPEDRKMPNSDLQTIGTKHLAIQVADMAGFKEKAVAYGVDIAHEVTMTGESVMFIRDPDGVLVELIQPPV